MKCFPKKLNNNGFTLIEVMISVVVLAILTLPLMGYFTNALSSAAKGKSIQKCEMAAQSILEEINSYNTYDQFNKEVVKPSSTWTHDPSTNDYDCYHKYVTVDGDKMIANVKLDFIYDHPATPSAILFNDYNVPQIKTLYCDSSVVAIEEKQTATAVARFYYKYHQSASEKAIENDMTRDFIINVSPSATDSKVLDVKVSFLYKYKGESYTASALADTQIAMSDFKNLYILYNASAPIITEEKVYMNVCGVDPIKAKDYGFYFIRQNPTDKTAPPLDNSFSLDIQPGTSLNTLPVGTYKYYTNGYSCTIGTYKKDIIDHALKKRIAHVTVDLYKASESVYNSSTRLAQVTSSKGE